MAEATEQGQTLEDLLDRAALTSDSDEYDDTIPVSLMTLHSAKGLEFDAVFLAGLEEGVLPHSRSFDTNAEIEEERRLFYVGMTRAKQSLVLSRAIYRRTYGEDRLRASLPSRFLAEIPADLIEAAAGSQSEPGETRRYEPDPEYSEGYSYRSRRTPYGRSAYTGSSSPRSAYGRTAKPAVPPQSPHIERSARRHARTPLEIRRSARSSKSRAKARTAGLPSASRITALKNLLERYANLADRLTVHGVARRQDHGCAEAVLPR